MSHISIITAFFDIGRGDWKHSGLPNYLRRTNDQYFDRFARMLKLDNDIVVYTEEKFSSRFDELKKTKPNLQVVYVDDWKSIWKEFRFHILDAMLQQKLKINIQQPWNPEYWSVDYVMLNYLKSWFVSNAYTLGYIKTNLAAWIDFGYPREDWQVPTNSWWYNFDPEKIHFFTTKASVPDYTDIIRLIETNDVFIMGCHIVANQQNWEFLKNDIRDNIDVLLGSKLVDDDQTLLYMSYIKNKEHYQIHHVDVTKGDWFQIFMNWNDMNA